MAMISISRSMLLAAALAAFPLAGAMAQHDPSKESTGSSSATAGAHKMGDAKNDSSAMKSTEVGSQGTKDVNGKPSENAAGQSGK
jgi:hypothetical protein